MMTGHRRLVQAAVASYVAAGAWLCVVALSGGWDAADPVASVLAGGVALVALSMSLGFGPGVGPTAEAEHVP